MNHGVGGQLADHELRVLQQGLAVAPSAKGIGHEAARSPGRVEFRAKLAGDLDHCWPGVTVGLARVA